MIPKTEKVSICNFLIWAVTSRFTQETGKDKKADKKAKKKSWKGIYAGNKNGFYKFANDQPLQSWAKWKMQRYLQFWEGMWYGNIFEKLYKIP